MNGAWSARTASSRFGPPKRIWKGGHMTPRGSIMAAAIGRTCRRHRAAASQTALLVALASGLANGFGAVVERLSVEGTASCAARATGVSRAPCGGGAH